MKRLKDIGLMAVAVAILAGCKDYDADIANSGEGVSVELAYTITSATAGDLTRQATDVVANNAAYPRHPQTMRIIPLINDAPDHITDSWAEPVMKQAYGDNPASLLYRSHYCVLPPKVNGFLVYSKVRDLDPPDDVPTKVYNGSLIENFPASIEHVEDYRENVSFSLEPIYQSKNETGNLIIPAGAQTLANCLTAIATTGDWHTSTDPTVKGFFEKFTNGGKDLPGSAASVREWIKTFRKSIESCLNPENASYIATLAAVDEEAASQLTAIASSTYPRDLNLPDGAAVLRWTERNKNNEVINRFVPQVNTTTLDNINSMARFAYPASLYYFVASDIKTSEEQVDLEKIYNEVETDGTKTAWQKVLENEKFNKTSVSSNTRAVVMTRPVQYAVAQLKVNIKANEAYLRDADNKSIAVGDNNFPLTGIIVCDQRPLNYEFVPKEIEPGVISDSEVLFIYDSQVTPGCCLIPDITTEACNTLVLQSYKDEDVNILLEFENNSGEPFTCIDGTVYPDTRFYLVGNVDASLYHLSDPNVNMENKDQVFTKDYITTVNMTVSSLAKAYNVPPNMLSNNLEIGVETTPQWVAATPTVIRLE